MRISDWSSDVCSSDLLANDVVDSIVLRRPGNATRSSRKLRASQPACAAFLQRRQNAGVKSTSKVKTSSRPTSIATISTHLPNVPMLATLETTLLSPGPVLLIAPATAHRPEEHTSELQP